MEKIGVKKDVKYIVTCRSSEGELCCLREDISKGLAQITIDLSRAKKFDSIDRAESAMKLYMNFRLTKKEASNYTDYKISKYIKIEYIEDLEEE